MVKMPRVHVLLFSSMSPFSLNARRVDVVCFVDR